MYASTREERGQSAARFATAPAPRQIQVDPVGTSDKMAESALVVSQSGRVTPGLASLVAARGRDPAETIVTDRPEDGEYYLSPATLTDVERWVSEAENEGHGEGGEPLVVVDGSLHPGQTADLRERLPSATVRDRRGAVWEFLGEENPVATVRFALRQARVARREAAATQRDDAATGPTGTSGQLADWERTVRTRREELGARRTAARERVRTGYDDVDGRAVVLGRVGAPTTDLWAALTGASGAVKAGRPARPRTSTTAVGPHTLAVTDVPGVPGEGGPPQWLTAAVPGLAVSLERASVVLGVGDAGGLADAVRDRFDVAWRQVDPTARAARAALKDVFETAELAIQLPYDDDAHALVSDLHDRATVRDTEYGDAVYLRVEASRTAAEEVCRRVSAVGGETKALDDEE